MATVTETLHNHATKPLRFVVAGEQRIPNDFHVTEIKKVSVDALDCGGNHAQWQELVVQLWSPEGKNDVIAMTAGKFVAILEKMAAVELLDSPTVRFEYGDATSPAVQYNLGTLHGSDTALEISLEPPYVACKPRLAPTRGGSSCC